MNKNINNLNTQEAAIYLESEGVPVSPKTLEVWRSKGRGPTYRKVARWVFYKKQDLDAFAEGQVYKTDVD